jgi:uroporphyrinogen decarboxylase
MQPRERVLRALRRQQPDRVPYDLQGFNREADRLFREKTGADDAWAYFGAEPMIANIYFKGTKLDLKDRYLHYHDLPEENFVLWHDGMPQAGSFTLSEWGLATVVGSNPAYDVFTPPLSRAKSISVIENYPMPDFEEGYRHAHLRESVTEAHAKGLASVGRMAVTIFETAWHIRGFNELLMDFVQQEDWANCLLDRITEKSCFRAAAYARAGCDAIHIGDDVGMEDRLLMSPETWRKFLKVRLAKVTATARAVKPDILFDYHSDGYVEPIIEDFIEIGIDSLNPVQPECMDPAKLKKQFGDRLAFWGTIGIQHTMPFGTPADVEAEVRTRIETVGKGGGLLVSPTHVLAPEVPHENIRAMVKAMRKYGKC